MMQNSKSIALMGAGVLFLGAFMPIISMPIVGPVNYFQNGRGDGVIIVVIAVATAALAMTGRTRHVLWTGLAALAMLAYTLIRFQMALADMREKMETELADNPFRGLAEAAIGAIQLQWGWAVLVLGAGMTIYAGWSARRGAKSAPADGGDTEGREGPGPA